MERRKKQRQKKTHSYRLNRLYPGSFVTAVKNILELDVDISKKIVPVGFHVIPKRWKVERTLAWLGNSRKLAKDFEIKSIFAETMIKFSHSHTLLKRL